MHSKHKFLILFIIPLFAFTMHKYYISLTKVEYKKESKSMQVTIRVFIDDLQEALNSSGDEKIELALSNESNENDTIINSYLIDKFNLKINNAEKTYTYLGKEYEEDVVYIYLEFNNIENINSIEVQNNILMEIFPTQKNIIKLNINNIKKTFLLTNKKDKDLLKFS